MKKGLLILAFSSVIILGALHQIGSAFYLYWDVSWFDTVMHFLGGLSVVYLFLWVWHRFKIGSSRHLSAWLAILFFIFVAAGWELFEYVFDISNPVGSNYLTDTIHDLIAGVVGAIVAAWSGIQNFFHDE